VTYQDGHSQLFTGTGAVVQHVENGLHIVLSGYSSDHAEFERLGIFVGNVLPGATTFGLTNNVYPLVALQANGYGDGSYFENIDPYLPLNMGSLAVSVSTEKVCGALNSYLGLNVLGQQKRFVAIKGEFIALPAKP